MSLGMKALSPRAGMVLAMLLLAVSIAGCSGIPQDGRYQSGGRGGGWENFRAEAPSSARAA
jgi:hypothetical protein